MLFNSQMKKSLVKLFAFLDYYLIFKGMNHKVDIHSSKV